MMKRIRRHIAQCKYRALTEKRLQLKQRNGYRIRRHR